MSSIGELKCILKADFGLHKARLDCLCKILFGLLIVRTVNLSALATTFGQVAAYKSHYRRLQRFFKEVSLPDYLIAHTCLRWFKPQGKVCLAIDRTNWQFGQQPINVLMLSVLIDGIAIPLIWDILPKKGNSNTHERIVLIRRFLKQFPELEIEALLMDREFIGQDWLSWLDAQAIPFIVRVKKNLKVLSNKNRPIHLSTCFPTTGRQGRCLNKKRSLFGLPLWVSGKKLEDGSHLLTVSNRHRKTALSLYRKRWAIETLFGNLKTRGFRLEDTHMANPQKIKTLVGILSLAYVWAFQSGKWAKQKEPINTKSHGRHEKSIFALGLQSMRQFLFSLGAEMLDLGSSTKTQKLCRMQEWLKLST